VGWNTRLKNGRWVPTFVDARHLWSRVEYEFWAGKGEAVFESMMEESVRPVFEAGLVDLVDEDYEVTDEVRLEPTPGHTPGHVSVHITSRGEEAIITGDLMHHPVQCAHPEWNSRFDNDAEQAEATRRSFLDRYAGGPVLIIGTHFSGATAGRIVRDGETYRLDA
jgi:glyoxylase-like metal-dependent hydrolase (beta-lactamase superfamily II)